MSSLLTNTSAMNALSTLRSINQNLATTQDRIGTGLKVQSAKDNAAYFSISESMKGDSAMYSAIDEGLTLTKNSLAAAEKGAKSFQDLAQEFTSRMAFVQNGTKEVGEPTQGEFKELVKQMETIIAQSTFNGDDLVGASVPVTTGATMAKDAATGKWAFTDAERKTWTADELTAADTAKTTFEGAFTALAAGAGSTLEALTGDDLTAAFEAVNAGRADAIKFADEAAFKTAAGTAVGGTASATVLDAAEVIAASNAVKTRGGDAAKKAALDASGSPAVAKSREAVTGISRAGGEFQTTKITVNMVDLNELASGFKALAEAADETNIQSDEFKAAAIKAANTLLGKSIEATTNLGQSGKSIENQQEFLKQLTDTLDNGVGAMVDADMEEEAARLQALQVQQQLATQSLSIANQGPQNLLSLFR